MAFAFTGTRVSAYNGDMPTHYIIQFGRNLNELAQQATRKISIYTATMGINGIEAWEDFQQPFESDQGLTDAVAGTHDPATASEGIVPTQRAARIEKMKWSYPVNYRRRITPDEWYEAFPFEKKDRERMLLDPKSPILNNAVKSMNRKIDNIFYTALGADVSQGVINASGSTWTWTDTAFPAGQVMTGSENNPFNVDLLHSIREKFAYNEENIDNMYPVILLDEAGWRQVFEEEVFISRDYNPDSPLPTYKLREFMGFVFIGVSSKRMTVVNNVVTSYCWMPDAMRLAWGEEISTQVGVDVEHHFKEVVRVSMELGAFRLRDTGVVKFQYQRQAA